MKYQISVAGQSDLRAISASLFLSLSLALSIEKEKKKEEKIQRFSTEQIEQVLCMTVDFAIAGLFADKKHAFRLPIAIPRDRSLDKIVG